MIGVSVKSQEILIISGGLMKDKWYLPTDFNTLYKTDAPKKEKSRWCYKFKGYVCPECNRVYQYTPAGDEPLIDFPTYGKDRKVCKDCA